MSKVVSIFSKTETPVTMSSKEIAKVTGKTHKNVVRDIRDMLATLQNDGSDLIHLREDKDSRGYTTEFYLPRDLTETLVTGYSVTLRLAVVRRLRELEEANAKPAPALTDAATLRGLLLGYTEQVLQLEHRIAEDKPKVEFYDHVAISEGCKTMLQAASILNTGRNNLFKYLRKHGVLITGGKDHNVPYQIHKDAGRFIVSLQPYDHPHTGEPMTGSVTTVTGKGLIWLQQFIEKNGRSGLDSPSKKKVA